jgi:hypothetical protein
MKNRQDAVLGVAIYLVLNNYLFHLFISDNILYYYKNFAEICLDVVHVELVSFVTHLYNRTASLSIF